MQRIGTRGGLYKHWWATHHGSLTGTWVGYPRCHTHGQPGPRAGHELRLWSRAALNVRLEIKDLQKTSASLVELYFVLTHTIAPNLSSSHFHNKTVYNLTYLCVCSYANKWQLCMCCINKNYKGTISWHFLFCNETSFSVTWLYDLSVTNKRRRPLPTQLRTKKRKVGGGALKYSFQVSKWQKF